VVTLGLLHALKGGGNRAFYRRLTRDYRPLFPRLPERTRLFRLFSTHQDWPQTFLASPTVLGVINTYGIELIHPIREGRSPQQIGRKGVSNHRWIVGGKLCLFIESWLRVFQRGNAAHLPHGGGKNGRRLCYSQKNTWHAVAASTTKCA
jgi:hypothetical protein